MRKDQKGFGAALIISLVVIAGLLGAIGWLVFKNNGDSANQTSADDNTAAKISSFEECVAAGNPVMESYPEKCQADGQTFINEKQQSTDNDDTEQDSAYDSSNWIEVTLKDGLLFKVADGWQIAVQDAEVAYSTEGESSLIYREGTPASIDKVTGGRDGSMRFLAAVDKDLTTQRSFKGYKNLGSFTTEGLSGTKYSRVEEGGEVMGPPAGTKNYAYYFEIGKDTYAYFSYNIYPGDKDRLDVVEAVIRTATEPNYN